MHEMNEASEQLYRIRHSLSHVMAQAVLELRPGTTLGFGPPIADGFYYDFVLSAPITEEDFPEIEKKMKHIIKQRQEFTREELDKDAAFARLDAMGEPYKREYAEELFEKKSLDSLTFYTNGPFLDMCDGPHVENTRDLGKAGFKIRSVAGAYWRGNSDNQMMTRLYAWAFETRQELDAHVKAWKDAQARDHKKLGKELDLFVIDDEIGKGLPLWMPNGTVIRDELEKLAKELEFKAGYVRVATPHIAKTSLYYKTGHLPYYATHMYPFMELKETRETESGTEEEIRETYCLKPMNCPHHHKIFAARPRSYRDLPLRLAEYGDVYRFEDSGALSGLLRVRGMSMNDAHIYCTEDQIKDEFLAVMKMHQEVYDILGLHDYYFRFSTWDPEDPKGKQKYVDDPAAWEKSQQLVHEAMVESGAKFVIGKGEAAFYGPKIDVQFRTVTGREETASTNQLDFAVPARLDLEYVGPDNKMHRPYIIHRAPLGTHERFVAFLIEHYGGAFPTWLAPVQVRVVTVGERFDEYAEKVVQQLRNVFVRAERDKSSDTMGKKIRNAVTAKIPNILIVGEREAEEGTVTLRRYGQEAQRTMSAAEFEADVLKRIAARKDD
ncbi:MAG: threonine--tRNA ligase [Deltaproteobacteria bacterium]|nr:MAG: threonine--tRNA ligase [Deltaproteobacteria bacterium]